MITITIIKKQKEIEEITLKGHAGFNHYGSDIVCSAVSSIVTTSVNGILSFKETITFHDDGNVLEIKIKEHDYITDTLIKNMLSLLEELELQYPKNIKIQSKGE